MRDDTRRIATDALWKALASVPIGQETDMYELAAASNALFENEDGEYELSGREGLHDEVWLDVIQEDLAERAEATGLLLESVGGDRFVPRRLASRGFDPTEVVELRISRSVWVPSEDCTRIIYGNDRFEVSRGFAFDEVIASKAAGPLQASKVVEALDYAQVNTWERMYYAPFCDGESWELLLRMGDGEVFVSEGSNEWPRGFWGLWQSLIMTILQTPLGEDGFEDNRALCGSLRFSAGL